MTWPTHTHTFFAELEANNTTSWYVEHKDEYASIELATKQFLAAEVERTAGESKIFRLRKDARFSKGQPPFRTEHVAGIRRPGGEVHSFRIDADGIAISVGMPVFEKPQLEAYRRAVSDPATATSLHQIVEDAAGAGFDLDDPQLKRPLRDLAEDHPHPDLSRHKSLQVSRFEARPAWLFTADAFDRIRAAWQAAGPLDDWLREHLGH